jgi:hypothetical protein
MAEKTAVKMVLMRVGLMADCWAEMMVAKMVGARAG